MVRNWKKWAPRCFKWVDQSQRQVDVEAESTCSTYTMMACAHSSHRQGLLMALFADYQRLRDNGVVPEAGSAGLLAAELGRHNLGVLPSSMMRRHPAISIGEQDGRYRRTLRKQGRPITRFIGGPRHTGNVRKLGHPPRDIGRYHDSHRLTALRHRVSDVSTKRLQKNRNAVSPPDAARHAR